MKKIILSSFLLTFCVSIKSQNNTKHIDNPRLIKANEQMQSRIANDNTNKNISVSEYFGLDEQIVSFMIKKEIPATLPKSKGFGSKTKFIETVNQWIKDNTSFIVPEKRNQFITE